MRVLDAGRSDAGYSGVGSELTPMDLLTGYWEDAEKHSQLSSRTLQFMSYGDSNAERTHVTGLGSLNVFGCGDSDGDGVDELLVTTRDSRNRTVVVSYDMTGKRKLSDRYNQFVRGFVVTRPNSQVPLIAVLRDARKQGRQVKIVTMAGSFAFPLFNVSNRVSISAGTFTTDSNEQSAGIYWADNRSRRVYRQLLKEGAQTTELFTLPKGYALARSQSVVRTAPLRKAS